MKIDEEMCSKHNLSLKEVITLLALKDGINKNIEELMSKGVLSFENEKYHIAPQWNDILDEILCDSSGDINDEERLARLATQMRECFPAGKMPGTAYYYRCNNREVILKLKKFFIQYGNYPDNRIIDATKRFIASFQGNYKFLPLIKYFISKNKSVMDEDGLRHITEVSELASYLENEGNDDDINNDDWLVSSRN